MDSIEKIQSEIIKSIKGSSSPEDFIKDNRLKQLFSEIKTIEPELRAEFGQKLNQAKQKIEQIIKERRFELESSDLEPIDVTAPCDYNSGKVAIFDSTKGTRHPLSSELEKVVDIFSRMGFEAIESRQLDDEKHMFDMLNFPENHPARDAYDTFWTEDGFIPPAHTSTMQNRILTLNKSRLETDGQIAAISYGRVFRNEDVDSTHEHTFYQCEGVFVSEEASFAQLVGILKTFLETYYGQDLKYKTQPDFFPFTEPSIQFIIKRPDSVTGKAGDWLELVPGGMIHPNVLKMAGIDSDKYRGFAWGCGIDRLVMLKYGIEDLRLFESGKLAFLEKFV